VKKAKLTDDLGTHRLSLRRGERGSETTRDDVDEDRDRCELRNRLLQELLRAHALDEAHVRTSSSGKLETVDRLLHTEDLCRVGTADDDEVRTTRDLVTSDDGSANAGDELLAGHDLLAEEMSAALGLHLILNMAGSDAGAVVLEDGAGDHGGSTETSVCVGNDGGDRVKRSHHRAGLDEVVEGGDGKIGHAEAGGGGGSAGLVEAGEPGRESGTSGDAVADTRGDDDTGAGKHLAETSRRVQGKLACDYVRYEL
jgi:hypothetical protein